MRSVSLFAFIGLRRQGVLDDLGGPDPGDDRRHGARGSGHRQGLRPQRLGRIYLQRPLRPDRVRRGGQVRPSWPLLSRCAAVRFHRPAAEAQGGGPDPRSGHLARFGVGIGGLDGRDPDRRLAPSFRPCRAAARASTPMSPFRHESGGAAVRSRPHGRARLSGQAIGPSPRRASGARCAVTIAARQKEPLEPPGLQRAGEGAIAAAESKTHAAHARPRRRRRGGEAAAGTSARVLRGLRRRKLCGQPASAGRRGRREGFARAPRRLRSPARMG